MIRKVDDEWEKARRLSQVKTKTWICNVQLIIVSGKLKCLSYKSEYLFWNNK